MNEVYINKKIQVWIDKLTDLFCLEDNKPTVLLRPKQKNKSANCSYPKPKQNSIINIGCKNGLRLEVLIHEFIHAMHYDHKWEINSYSNFRSNYSQDQYSKLICKDLTGQKELII